MFRDIGTNKGRIDPKFDQSPEFFQSRLTQYCRNKQAPTTCKHQDSDRSLQAESAKTQDQVAKEL